MPFAVYITSPDYLGNMADIRSIADVCHKYSIPLIVDNAHGAYLRFLPESYHPMDLGADMCCDSAHKTLPVLTGGAYLHISRTAPEFFSANARSAMALFGSTSPSYLILESLDLANLYMASGYSARVSEAASYIRALRKFVDALGFKTVGNELMKLTVKASSGGYSGTELADILDSLGIVAEFADPDFIVFMFSAENAERASHSLLGALRGLEKRPPLKASEELTSLCRPIRRMPLREAVFSKKEKVPAKNAKGRILAGISVTCPPAVSLVVAGEEINESVIEASLYYGIDEFLVVSE